MEKRVFKGKVQTCFSWDFIILLGMEQFQFAPRGFVPTKQKQFSHFPSGDINSIYIPPFSKKFIKVV